ncbi:MAG: addiction module antidote protein, HigA family [Chloroflexi bacterium]|nr:MAG: addiction module antidote protein, HigA family [Chloroflexota bacterium]
MSANLIPARVPPPGRIIRRELEARGWTQKDLADIMGRPEQTISQIVTARKQITSDTALQLAAAFGTSPDLWLGLEADYRLHLARKASNHSEVKRKSRLYSRVPLTEIIRRGWIRKLDTLEELEQEVCSFLEVSSLEEQPAMAVSLRRSEVYEAELAAQVAWIKRVEHPARAQVVGNFDRARLEAALPELLTLAAAVEGLQQIPDFLQTLGVHFLIVPHLPNTYLDGAAFRLDDHPVLALTLRYDRIDNFWFTLMHELAHIIAGHEGLYLDNLDKPAESPEEAEANQMAQDWLIDAAALEQFVAATAPYFSHQKIKAFAATQHRHPGIIVGQLHHDQVIEYSHSRRFLVKVSPYLGAWIDVPAPV